MTEEEKDHLVPSINVELPSFTARSLSLSVGPNASYESVDASISRTRSLHRLRTTEFSQISDPLYVHQKPRNVLWLKHREHQNNSYTVTPAKIGHGDSSNDRSGERGNHLLKSGPLGLCNDPDCISCPAKTNQKAQASLGRKAYSILYGNTDGWVRNFLSTVSSFFPVMNPHAKVVQWWNKFFVISCLVAIFIDPLFFFPLSVRKDNKCMVLNWPLAVAIAAIRSVTDFIYLLHMLLQFRLAYVAPESRVVGAGDLVDQPKKIADHYLRGYFALDAFVLLPLPQVMIMVVIPCVGATANFAKNFLRIIVLVQYVPRIIRVLPMIAGQSASGFIFESAWANFFINLLMYVLAGHVVGSCWYLFGLQRVNKCLQDACSRSQIQKCHLFIDCTHARSFVGQRPWQEWIQDFNSSGCFSINGDFQYGIYQQVVDLTTKNSIVTKYIYSLFWGFQQISTLAGNLVPSYFEWEVLFTMAIIGLGLLLFALLIGNMQNFLLALGRRQLDMQLRRRDVDQWMRHRRLPEDLMRQVRQAERFSWVATRGANEEQLIENLPEDLQRDIRRHLFKFLKKIRIFSLMDEPMLDIVLQKLSQTLYIKGSWILNQGSPIEKMFFIVRGKMESIGADGNVAPLSEGDFFGEELLMWYLEHSSLNKESGKLRLSGNRLLSNRTVYCLTNVEAFALRSADLEEITSLFARFLKHPHIQAEIRFQSPYWRCMAAIRIQVAWRYRQKKTPTLDKSMVCPFDQTLMSSYKLNELHCTEMARRRHIPNSKYYTRHARP